MGPAVRPLGQAAPDGRLRRAFALLAATWIAIVAGNICKFIFVEIHPLVDWSDSWWVNLPFLATFGPERYRPDPSA